jgi:hypothetical protein
MRHLRLVLVVFVLCGASIALGRSVLAQDSTPTLDEQHALVGTWSIDRDIDDPTDVPALALFGTDGTFMEVETDEGQQNVAVGAWQPTGPQSAQLTIWSTSTDGTSIVRANIDIAADGNTFTAPYTVEVVLPDGTSTGEVGPLTAHGSRLTVEPQGTPVAASFEDLFGTPEATPSS